MMREHFTKGKDGEFMGIISRVTSSGRYKPNWVWQKVNPLSSGSESRQVEGKQEQEEGEQKQEQEEGEQKQEQEEGESGKPKKKKVIFVKRKTLKKTPSLDSP
jgi:hypothetical protein